MKKLYLFKTFLLACILGFVGTTNAMAEELSSITLGTETLSFSDFSNVGSQYSTAIQGAFPCSDGNTYSGWEKSNCSYQNSKNKKVLQIKASTGYLITPTITSSNGFKVIVTYSSTRAITITSTSDNVSANDGGTVASASTTGTGLEVSLITTSASTQIKIAAGGKVGYVSKIELIPNGEGSETLQEPDFSFSTGTASATLGETFTPPTLTNTSDGVVSYGSSNESVATVGADGTITLLAGGTTTITVSVPKTDNFFAAEASYDLTVIDPNAPIYTLVTSPLQLVPGDIYLITANTYEMALGAVNGTYRSGTPVIFIPEDKTKIVIAGDAVELTLGGTSGAWTFSDGTGYLYGENANTLKTNSNPSNDSEKATIEFDGNNVNISFKGFENRNLRWNASSPRFACYTSGQQPIQLYHKVIDKKENLYTTLTAEEEGAFYGTAYSEKALTVPTGLEAGVITDAAANGVLAVDYRYAAGATVPAKTAVLLKGSVAEQKFVATTSDEVAPTDNLLHGADAVDADGKTFVEGSNKYYLLSFDKETGKDLGFYYGAADGAAVTYKAPYAFLAVPQAIAANLKGFRLNGEATGIESIAGTKDNANAPVFDLSGRRVQNAVKGGVYIQNGKKFIVK